MSHIDIRDNRAAGLLEAVEGGEVIGRIQYFVLEEPGRALVPVHTVVDPGHEGRGVGGSLATELYAVAAREGLAVAPLCPYVVKWAARHPEDAPPADPALTEAAETYVLAHPGQF